MDLMTLALMGAVFVGAYFLMIRPQQKRLREQQELAAKMAEGDRVMLTSGVFGTIRHLGTKQAVVEVSPGVELTVLRQAIVRTVPADEEEFEYADGGEPVEPAGVAAPVAGALVTPEPQATTPGVQPGTVSSPQPLTDPVSSSYDSVAPPQWLTDPAPEPSGSVERPQWLGGPEPYGTSAGDLPAGETGPETGGPARPSVEKQ